MNAYRIAWHVGQGAITGALLLICLASPARAQSDDTLMLMNRLNDLDAQVQSLKAGRGGGGMPQSLGTPVTGAGAADLDVRLSQIQDQIQTLTGQVETQSNQIAQIRTENQRMTQDIQMRLNDLEAKVGGAAPSIAGAAIAGSASDVQPSAMPKSQGGTLGTLNAEQGGATPASSGTGSPEKDYETAYNLLAQSDYAGAETGFKTFLQTYPKQALSGNADYWLGETYFARGMMDKAAATYADTYKKYPNGAKAPDALLRLGMSLGQEGKASQACLAFAELNKQFPSASQKIKSTAAQERSRFKCQ